MSEAGHSDSSTSSRMRVVDTHHHLWDLSRYRYDWLTGSGDQTVTAVLGDYAGIRVDYLIDELTNDFARAGIVKSVHVQADFSEPDSVLETRWLQEISDAHGFPHAIVAATDLRSRHVAAELDRHCAFAGMRGIRMPESDDLLSDASFRRGVGAMAERGLSLEADVPLRYMPDLRNLAQAFPDMRFFLGHTGFPEERTDDYFAAWRAGMQEAAAAPNVVLKISGLGMRDHDWSIDSIRPWVMAAIEVFGVQRCIFGSNWPVDRLYSNLPTLIDAYRTVVSGFSHDEQDDLLWRNAERYYAI